MRFVISGGAPLDKKVAQGFTELGIEVAQGYGLTESSPVIAAEDDKYQKLGSIGKAFPSLEVKIDEPDEEGNQGPQGSLGSQVIKKKRL